MEIRDITPKNIPFLSGAGQALLFAADKLGKDSTAIVREVTRRPLTKAEILLIVQLRADALADKGTRP